MSNLPSTETVFIETHDNPLTDRVDDRYGRVVNSASVTEDKLIERVIESGTDLKAVTIKAAYDLLKKEALKAVKQGSIVSFGLGYISLDVEGTFFGDVNQWNPDEHRLLPHLTASKDLREALRTTPVRVLGKAPDGNVIASVQDVVTDKVNETLTINGIAIIKGTKIKIAGTKPGVGLKLINQDTGAVYEVATTSIGVNDPKRVLFTVPMDVMPGGYIVSIVSQYTGSGRLLSNPRTTTFNQVLTVS
jgi:hypothetical protein